MLDLALGAVQQCASQGVLASEPEEKLLRSFMAGASEELLLLARHYAAKRPETFCRTGNQNLSQLNMLIMLILLILLILLINQSLLRSSAPPTGCATISLHSQQNLASLLYCEELKMVNAFALPLWNMVVIDLKTWLVALRKVLGLVYHLVQARIPQDGP